MNDVDFPRRAKLVLNKNVPEKYHIIDYEIIRLRPLLQYYGKVPSERNVPNAQPYSQSDPAYIYDNMSYDPYGNPKPNPNIPSQPQQGPSPAYQAKNQEYANLSTFSRSQMMRWVLEKAPFIHYSKIEPFIALFETDERNLMMNSTLYTE
jgi:hypothetical protein